MQFRRLGRTNLRVSVVGLGTNELRRVPERQAIETCKRAFALGVNLVNAEPEYEGAFGILRRAMDESEQGAAVQLSVQTGGSREEFERERIALFGANVWGAAAGGIFGSDHGSPGDCVRRADAGVQPAGAPHGDVSSEDGMGV